MQVDICLARALGPARINDDQLEPAIFRIMQPFGRIKRRYTAPHRYERVRANEHTDIRIGKSLRSRSPAAVQRHCDGFTGLIDCRVGEVHRRAERLHERVSLGSQRGLSRLGARSDSSSGGAGCSTTGNGCSGGTTGAGLGGSGPPRDAISPQVERAITTAAAGTLVNRSHFRQSSSAGASPTGDMARAVAAIRSSRASSSVSSPSGGWGAWSPLSISPSGSLVASAMG